MTDNFGDEDVRIQKTNGALVSVMSKLLDLKNFNKITVKNLCEEAQISRATFYAHFHDKYDLLEYWLAEVKSKSISGCIANKGIKKSLNAFVNNNEKKIRHLIEDANSETLGLFCNFLLSLFDMDTDNGHMNSKYIVLSKFCCGGIMNYLNWQAINKSKINSEIAYTYFYDILYTLSKWYGEDE